MANNNLNEVANNNLNEVANNNLNEVANNNLNEVANNNLNEDNKVDLEGQIVGSETVEEVLEKQVLLSKFLDGKI
jgi:hypothetical protein